MLGRLAVLLRARLNLVSSYAALEDTHNFDKHFVLLLATAGTDTVIEAATPGVMVLYFSSASLSPPTNHRHPRNTNASIDRTAHVHVRWTLICSR